MEEEGRFGWVGVLVVAFCLVVVAQALVLFFLTDQFVSGKAVTGTARFCINRPPVIVVPCAGSVYQESEFSCVAYGTDPENGSVGNFSSQFVSDQVLFEVSSTGLINFTPNATQVGNHTITVRGLDNSTCVNAMGAVNFSFEVIDVNDPPYLVRPVPNVTMVGGITFSAYFLNDYFDDYENDPLTYAASAVSGLSVSVLPSSEVQFVHALCQGDDLSYPVVFTATDPGLLSADSNLVVVSVQCSDPPRQSSSGGGGGGGGNSTSTETIPITHVEPFEVTFDFGRAVYPCSPQ
ncbi:MAG: hypothetical protein HC945_04175 [Nitrosarchaeum sp.]|nr:hypothetical protein [Nitrosarchaeum sp.]